jgi:phage repressor protein C with HTH and peptisase S24 domain
MRVGVVVVSGRSMQPTLEPGDRLLVRYDAVPAPDDLVVVRLPEGTVAVKRAVRREAEGWWVERDNRAQGTDSWSVGAIPDHDVVAVVSRRIWPIRRGLGRRRVSR